VERRRRLASSGASVNSADAYKYPLRNFVVSTHSPEMEGGGEEIEKHCRVSQYAEIKDGREGEKSEGDPSIW